MATAFARSADFALDKPAGRACPNLAADFRCGIHTRLRDEGFPGCTVYDCFGAGQQLSQVTFGGRDWRAEPSLRERMFPALAVMRALHELLWYLREAQGFPAARPVRAKLARAFEETEALTRLDAGELLELDVDAHRGRVNPLVLKASELARAGTRGPDHRGGDLLGKRFRKANLRGASLRGALAIGADFTGADLREADVIGADLRGANLSGADLSTSLFLTQSQVDSATGDKRTLLPPRLEIPRHWGAPA
ncbi:pentapeptide repeat-containing protein [Amycolatopsis acidicola]|uniref:pentapeptide repeat-containing protein n=1 Tax=Amycolatopsis acidicola TaxID=2596893 RepID=UPI00312CB862